MIRFLDLKDQITEGNPTFAYWDTISNTILSFGECEQQVFSSILEFEILYGEQSPSKRPIERYISLIPNGFFNYEPKNTFLQ